MKYLVLLFLALSTMPGSLQADEACEESVKSRLGQLFYVNVDDFASKGEKKVGLVPASYLQLVKDLQVGAIIPHLAFVVGAPIEEFRATLLPFQKVSQIPLLVGPDDLTLRSKTSKESTVVGFGVAGGWVGDYGGKIPDECLENLSLQNAFLERAAGVNLVLGPTIDTSKRYGFLGKPLNEVEPRIQATLNGMASTGILKTLKHFPFTPDDYNLDKQNRAEQLTPAEVAAKIKVFKDFVPQADLVMTTHIYDPLIDPADLVTFSKKWMRILREDVGYKGLVVTDGLFSMGNYPTIIKQMSQRWDATSGKIEVQVPQSIYAARAILAGHDMVFAEGNSSQVRKIFADITRISCMGSKLSNELRGRIFESYDRIISFKTQHRDEILRDFNPPPSLVTKVEKAFASARAMDRNLVDDAYCSSGWNPDSEEGKQKGEKCIAYLNGEPIRSVIRECKLQGNFRSLRNEILLGH